MWGNIQLNNFYPSRIKEYKLIFSNHLLYLTLCDSHWETHCFPKCHLTGVSLGRVWSSLPKDSVTDIALVAPRTCSHLVRLFCSSASRRACKGASWSQAIARERTVPLIRPYLHLRLSAWWHVRMTRSVQASISVAGISAAWLVSIPLTCRTRQVRRCVSQVLTQKEKRSEHGKLVACDASRADLFMPLRKFLCKFRRRVSGGVNISHDSLHVTNFSDFFQISCVLQVTFEFVLTRQKIYI